MLAALTFFVVEVRVVSLIDQMADPSYRVREAAVRSVAAAGHFAVPALKRKLEAKPSREVDYNCKRALAIIYRSDYYAVYPTLPGWKKKTLPGWKEKKYPRLSMLYRSGTVLTNEEYDKHRAWLKSLKLPINSRAASLEADDHYRDKDQGFYYYTKDGTFSDPHECDRYATQLYVRQLLDAGVGRDVVQQLVNRLAEIEMRP